MEAEPPSTPPQPAESTGSSLSPEAPDTSTSESSPFWEVAEVLKWKRKCRKCSQEFDTIIKRYKHQINCRGRLDAGEPPDGAPAQREAEAAAWQALDEIFASFFQERK